MNVYSFVIPPQQDGAKLYGLTARMLPEISEHAVREAFERRDVKQDGKRVDKNARAVAGAEIKLYTQEGAKPLDVLFLDDNLMVVRKPVGVSCESDAKGGKTIAQMAWDFLRKEDPASVEPLLCHRLDNQTDGLLALARTQEAQDALTGAFAKRQIHKAYVCVVRGTPTPAQAVCRAWLQKDALHAEVKVLAAPRGDAQEIVTEYEVLEAGEAARLRVTLHTGRTHQIRAHMAYLGHPLLGDDKYGDRDFNRAHKGQGLRLCAAELGFALEGKWAYMNEHVFTVTPRF